MSLNKEQRHFLCTCEMSELSCVKSSHPLLGIFPHALHVSFYYYQAWKWAFM